MPIPPSSGLMDVQVIQRPLPILSLFSSRGAGDFLGEEDKRTSRTFLTLLESGAALGDCPIVMLDNYKYVTAMHLGEPIKHPREITGPPPPKLMVLLSLKSVEFHR